MDPVLPAAPAAPAPAPAPVEAAPAMPPAPPAEEMPVAPPEPAHEEAEMRMAWVPFADLRDAVLAGDVQDAPVVIAVLAAQARGLMSP